MTAPGTRLTLFRGGEKTEDESRCMTQTWTAKSYERSLRSSHAGVVKFGEFSSQIQLPQTTGRDKLQCRGTIRNIFKVRTKAFSKVDLTEKQSVFTKSQRTTQLAINTCMLTCASSLYHFLFLSDTSKSQCATHHSHQP